MSLPFSRSWSVCVLLFGVTLASPASAVPAPGSFEVVPLNVAEGRLSSIDFVDQNDGWAVGTRDFEEGSEPTALHWDGQQCSRVDVPPKVAMLDDVSALSSSDVWAATTGEIGGEIACAAHWDGRAWSVVSHEPLPPEVFLVMNHAVKAFAANDVWIGGQELLSRQKGQADGRPLLQHWDGTHLVRVTYTETFDFNGQILDLNGTAADDLWAVGTEGKLSSERAFVVHWDGAQFTRHPIPPVDGAVVRVLGVHALARNDVWAVGTAYTGKDWLS
jgi:hypothetical protein